MKQLQNLIALYKPQIIPQQKSISDLQTWLQKRFDVEEIPLSEFSDAFWKQLTFSATNAITNRRFKITNDKLNFIAYRLPLTEKNKAFLNGTRNVKDQFIYVIFESNTGFISTNHAHLHLELSVEQGISQYDYDNDTEMLIYYITCMDKLQKKEY